MIYIFSYIITVTIPFIYSNPLWGDKSEYVNPYIPTQTQEEYWSDHMQNHQADSPLYVWPDVWSADLHLFIKNMAIHDIECPYWDQMSLNNTNQSYTQKWLVSSDDSPVLKTGHFAFATMQLFLTFSKNPFLFLLPLLTSYMM